MDSRKFSGAELKFKDAVIELEDGDDILKCIALACVENNISKCEVKEFSGKAKTMCINYIEKGSLKRLNCYEEKKIITGNGEFKYDFVENKLHGRVRVLYEDGSKRFSGVLTKGVAKNIKIVLRFVEMS